MARRNRIPHGKLLPAHKIKSGMTVWHARSGTFKSVHRTGESNGCTDLYLTNGLGMAARRTVMNRDKLVFVKITVRAAKRKEEYLE